MLIRSNILGTHQNTTTQMWNTFNDIQNFKFLVIGYKISHPEYFFLNILLTLVGFLIYKAYFLSNNLTNHYDIYYIFKSEFKLTPRYYESKQKNITFVNTLTCFI